jgi:A1 cistron-splicing factor AAR2
MSTFPHRSARDAFLDAEGGVDEQQQDHAMVEAEEEEEVEEIVTPGAVASAAAAASRPSAYGSAAAHPSTDTMSPAEALRLTREGAQVVIVGLPPRTQFGIDYWSFHAGKKFTGMKMIPPGIHFVWTAPSGVNETTGHRPDHSMMDPDMVPRIGEFVWLRGGDVWLRRWDPVAESLSHFEDEREEQRYALGAKRFDFDAGQGPYPINEQQKWRTLTNYVSEQLVHRLEPVDQLIGVGKSKYAIEDKKPAAPSAESTQEQEQKKADQPDTTMTDVDATPSTPAASPAASPAAASSSSSSSLNPNRKPRPSTSFYTHIPSVASMIASTAPPNESPDIRAARITALHIDQTPILESILAQSVATPSDEDREFAPLTPAERDLLGEMQFAFVAFLVGQDYEGFDAWKRCVVLLTSCVEAIATHHALYERWIAVLAMQLNAMPRDFFVDNLSGENFLHPSLSRLFDAAGEAVIPTSLVYALKELRVKLQEKFMWHVKQLPGFLHRDELLEQQQQAAAAPLDSAAQLAAFKRQLQAEAEEDEYAPTIAED